MDPMTAWLAVAAGALVTWFWRALGVAVSGRINPRSAVFDWIGCVAYALLAGLVARMIVLPLGPLQATGLGTRLTATAAALVAFYAAGRSLPVGMIAGLGVAMVLFQAGVRW